MAYIGKTPITGNFVKLDAISVVNGQAAYTMNNGGSAFTDYENVNQFLVSLNGILQSPTTSFTVSGSTLTFASNLATGDVIDFIIVLGNTLDIGTPSDNTVSLAKLTATGTKDATTFLRGDNTFAEAGGGGILQVKSATKTDTQTFSGGTRLDITGLSVTLTPSSTSNKVLVRFMVTHWGNDSHCQIERSINGGSYSIIFEPSTAGNRTPTHSGGSHRNINELNTATMEVLDAPNTTSSITYKITFNNGAGGGSTGYVNRSSADSETDANVERAISTVTAMEIDSGVL